MKKITKMILFATLLLLLVSIASASEVSEDTITTITDATELVDETNTVSQDDIITDEINIKDNLEMGESQNNIEDAYTPKAINKKSVKDANIKEDSDYWTELKVSVTAYSNFYGNYTIHPKHLIYNNNGGPITWDSKQCVLTIDGGFKIAGLDGRTVIKGNDTASFIITEGSSLIIKNLSILNTKLRHDNGGTIVNHGNLTLINCQLSDNNAYDGMGGAIYNTGNLNLINCTLTGNEATYCDGGAIYSTGNLTVFNSTLNNNKGYGSLYEGGNGGAIYSTGYATIINSTLQNNNALNYMSGGAVFSTGTLTIINSTLSNNNAYGSRFDGGQGGAIYSAGTLYITNSILSENYADIYGGAISFGGQLTIYDTTLSNNRVQDEGGAIYNNWGTSTIINSTLDHNSATNRGGAITNRGTITLNNCTLNNNNGDYGGAIHTDGTLYVNDTILKENNARTAGAIAGAKPFTLTNSVLDNNTATQNGGAVQIYSTSSTMLNITFNNNHAVKGGAVYIFYGKPNLSNITLDNNIATDGGAIYNEGGEFTLYNITLDNNIATENGGAIYNYWGTVTIKKSTVKNNTAKNGGVIYNRKTLSISESLLEKNVASENGGAIFNIETTKINNITLKNNKANLGGTFYNSGKLNINNCILNNYTTISKAIYNSGNLAITDSILSNNTDTQGGILCNDGNLTITQSTLSNNNATYGGVIYNNGNLDIKSSELYNNNATYGGAIYSIGKTITITESTLNNNEATNGGTIHGTNGTVTITSSTISNSISREYGGAIFNNGTLNINGTTINNNHAIHGGAIFNYKDLDIRNSKLNNNYATYGGTLNNYKGNIYIAHTTINNGSANSGGAVYNLNGTINLYDSTFNINNATNGGAIHNNIGTIGIANTIFDSNRATENGGAISNNGTLTMYDSSLINNNATCGGALFNYDGENVKLNVTYTMFAENHATTAAAIFSNNSYTSINIINNTFTQNTADDKETLVIQGEKTQKDNTYNSTDIRLNNISLIVKDNQEMFRKGEEEVLNFTIELANPSNYDEDIMGNIEDLTIYINDEKNTTTNYANYTLRILQPDNYEIYFTSCNYESNHIKFIVEPNDSILTTGSSYNYLEGEDTKILINITDYSQKGGTINLYVKDGDEYKLLSMYPNVKDRLLLSTNTLHVALENIYDSLASSYVINLTYTSNFAYVTPSSTEFTFNIIQKNVSGIEIIPFTGRNVKSNTILMVNPVESSVGSIATLSANITDEKGRPVTDGRAIFKVNGITLKDENGNIIYAMVSNGTASIKYKVQTVWIKNTSYIEAVYSGSEKYTSSRTKSIDALKISQGTAKITLDKTEITAETGQTITLRARVVDSSGHRINTDKVVFKLNGKTLTDNNGNVLYAKVVDGEAVLDYTIPSNYNAKTYNLTAVFGGGNYEQAKVTGKLTIKKMAVTISTDSITTNNGKTTVKATILDESGKLLVRNTKLTFKVNGKTILTAVNSNNGKIDVSFITSLKPGLYNLLIISGENGIYYSGKITVVLQIS